MKFGDTAFECANNKKTTTPMWNSGAKESGGIWALSPYFQIVVTLK